VAASGGVDCPKLSLPQQTIFDVTA
jgi:hypothetical protein